MRLSMAICDDDPPVLASFGGMARRWATSRGHDLLLDSYPSAEALLFAREDRSGWDILLLDIEMPGMDGVGLAKKLRETDRTSEILFITGFPDFMQEGYEVGAIHYLLKPVKEEKLFEVLDRAADRLLRVPRYLFLSSGRESERVLFDDILYAESDGHYVRFHTRTGEKRLRATIPEAEILLGEDFFRVSRSYLAPLRLIKAVSHVAVTLEDGTVLPLGRGLYDGLNRALIAYFRRS